MLVVDAVTKTYLPPPPLLRPLVRTAAREPVRALSDVSLTLPAGHVLGLVGPNGAGKTTLIRIVSTLLLPTSGRVQIDGLDAVTEAHEVRKRIGLVLAEDRGLYWRISGVQNLEFFGAMVGLRPAAATQRAHELMEMVGLAGRDKLVFGYSAGMRTRLSLARSLLIDPPLLILDEPTKSLDPVATVEIGQMLRALAHDGKAVLLSSHRLDEVAAVCDEILVMHEGSTRFRGTVADLTAQSGDLATELVRLLGGNDEEPG